MFARNKDTQDTKSNDRDIASDYFGIELIVNNNNATTIS